MIAFKYRALNRDGSAAQGVIEAPDRRDALDRLSREGLFPSSLEAVSTPVSTGASAPAQPAVPSGAAAPSAPPSSPESKPVAKKAARPVSRPLPEGPRPAHGRISRKEITAFTRQMATLLAATIPIPKALDGLADQAENPALAEVVQRVSADVRQGQPFSEALAAYPKLFSTLYSSMVEVGEESGQLDSVLEDLADFLEDQDEMRGEVLSAIAYPAFVMGLGGLTTFILLTFVMPKLLGMMTDLSDALPLPTRVLLLVSEFFSQWWPATIVGGILLVVGFQRWVATESGRRTFDRWRLSWPVMGRVFRASALARFARTLGTLHRAGVSLLRALEIVRNTVGNTYVSDRVYDIAEETKGGDSLAEPIRRLGLFPPTMIQMIAVGEETGRLGEMLLKVAQIQEKETRSAAQALISLLGPLLIVAVGVVVGFIVIALLLPIFQISQGMG